MKPTESSFLKKRKSSDDSGQAEGFNYRQATRPTPTSFHSRLIGETAMNTHDAPSNSNNADGSTNPNRNATPASNTPSSPSSNPNLTHSNPSDSDFMRLLSAARGGDSEATGQLLQWYANYLNILASSRMDRRLARRLNPSDIVQEAMMAGLW